MENNTSYIGALGNLLLFNYSHNPSGVAVDTKANTILVSGEAIAEAKAETEAFFDNLKLSRLVTENSGFGIDGVFEGSTESESQIIANFEVKKGEKFSLDFVIDSLIEANEIDNIDLEYNEAELNIGFLVVDSSGKIIDHLYLETSLISSEQIGDVQLNSSNNFKLNEHQESYDLDGNNGIDFVASLIKGTYERNVNNDTTLTLLKINSSEAYWFGDFLINNLGSDFIYGTIHDDLLFGTQKDDKFYASFGDDILFGWDGKDHFIAGSGNDWLYGGSHDDSLYGENGDDSLYGETGDDLIHGGKGNDSLYGGNNDDQLFGGSGDDWLYGGRGDDIIKGGEGNDTLTGNKGADKFIYKTVDSFASAKIGVDIITDLEVNTDKIILSQRTFSVLTPTTDGFIDADQFKMVANDELAAVSSAFIIYSADTGKLFYNQNGSDEGLGQGGQFATLQNIPSLKATDFIVNTTDY
ncbi:MAG: calcium-binding protein [Xenococcaceae cyanobacterium MO_167.B52]|nr:calcium-binding protein [Xenococcaceae cyanobacterium MO_167.B52]